MKNLRRNKSHPDELDVVRRKTSCDSPTGPRISPLTSSGPGGASAPPPGTPPKKIWEKQYGSFLRKKKSTTDDEESSVRGGNLFGNLYRRRSASKSTDELDETKRRGVEKGHSPKPTPKSLPSTYQAFLSEAKILPPLSTTKTTEPISIKKVFTDYHNKYENHHAYLGERPNEPKLSLSARMSSSSETAASQPDLLLRMPKKNHPTQPIHIQNQRLLKQLSDVSSWQPSRRYLIAPAVLSILSPTALGQVGHFSRNNNNTNNNLVVELGHCLLSYKVTTRSTTKTTYWSTSVLVLYQNYLLEYDPTRTSRRPRGFCHLQYSSVQYHEHFTDTLLLHFYGSPCAKSDARTLLIKVVSDNNNTNNNNNTKSIEEWKAALEAASELTQISNLYDLSDSKPLGCGMYSKVCSAKSRHGRPCAIKVFDKTQFWQQVVEGKERADTIVRETAVQATVLSKCSSIDSLLRLQGFFETSEFVVLELELLDGTDLFEYISSKSTLPEPEAAQIVYEILTALDGMATAAVAHRDIKPANVLMCQSESPRVKVGDFGMAGFVDIDGNIRGRCGTPGYVAPEIFTAGLHGGYGNKVDIFSAGVILYVCLCGYEPFYGETDHQLKEANKAAHIDFPQDEWAHISDEALDLVKQMMAKDPSNRPTAREALQHAWFQTHVNVQAKAGSSVYATDTVSDTCIVS